ncbi:MAG: DUF4097 family beta strand repeat-containing protein [Frankiaceae bacterium]
MQRTFPTPDPTGLHVEIGSGRVTVRAEQTDETRVDVHGEGAEETVVEQRGNQIVVIGPKHRLGLFRSSPDLSVQVSMPLDSELVTQLGTADLTVTGRLRAARLKTGSGDIEVADVAGEATADAGSGDIEIGAVGGDVRVRCGSGRVTLGQVGGAATVSTGSGDIEIGSVAGPAELKSGSGDARVGEARSDVTASTASGDVLVETMHVGRLQAKNVSGDIHVGVPAGVPVWTDVSTLTGHIHSSLAGAGEPSDGQPFIELRAVTVSGDIRLEQL